MALKYAQTNTQYLAGSGVIVGATSVVLTAFTDIYGNALALADFGTKGYGSLEPDTTNEESFTFTTVTVNANGTVTLGGVSTALAKSPYTETSGLVRAHSGGTKVVISDTTAFWNTFTNKNNDETVTGRWGSATVPSAGNDYTNKTYVDGVAVAGAPNANTTTKGIVQEATQAQVLAKTAAGSTGAELYVNPTTLASTLLSDYKADTGAANAYVITPVPAITAYTVGQIFSFKATNANTTVSTINVNGLGAKTIKKLDGVTDLASGDIAAGEIVMVEYDGTNFQMQNPVANAPHTLAAFNSAIKFGGTGSDGALTLTSGATNIDLAGASLLVKNYTSISITGTGSLTFSNPAAGGTLVVLKSQGAVTLTSSTAPMIDMSGMGAAGGASVTNGGAASGNTGTAGNINGEISTNAGTGGNSAGPTAGTAGAAVTSMTYTNFFGITDATLLRYKNLLFAAAGGGAGSVNNGTSSVGGRGGGALAIECAGAWNFTTAAGISVAGKAPTGSPSGTRGGSGAGAGGSFLALFNTLTANSGTVTVTGGTGETGSGATTAGAGGGSSDQAGTNGTTATPAVGGNGASGRSLSALNTLFL